ncbi:MULTISPECIES: Blp family class II bacteriocin [Ligilactobacillus]|uniref:ABC transporter permease n=1 Tax=Ligilactobacillus murinus TaxID=1622 RepID=A0A2Z4VY85_9LACO|nr:MULTISPECIES: Blp family class II bacteriocin [Ligilactobacillus]AWZ38977.1 ABC transporter permease [Ligilactobacillus murinus]AWZ39947.1 ABC transporter permease [Ligilactobacillus murinus]MCR1890372.1 Blp family class II bacteriocin [Ligilactobacillus murinus]TGY54625.1 ABC transporter permease [Ligilactobacillus murinus]WOY89272.1 Blp family class II bacteriocin [Ligilactobacillus murinus]
MTDNNQKFTLMTEKDLSSVVGGKGEYGASGNRYVHCGAGIVGGALIGAIGGPWGAVSGAIAGGSSNCF